MCSLPCVPPAPAVDAIYYVFTIYSYEERLSPCAAAACTVVPAYASAALFMMHDAPRATHSLSYSLLRQAHSRPYAYSHQAMGDQKQPYDIMFSCELVCK